MNLLPYHEEVTTAQTLIAGEGRCKVTEDEF